ncbi:hypothetical protein QJS66_14965 [Kocuria rhizophila]|nr:hypothetical protein QJS66_14965 [Kocuria rhizophila]
MITVRERRAGSATATATITAPTAATELDPPPTPPRRTPRWPRRRSTPPPRSLPPPWPAGNGHGDHHVREMWGPWLSRTSISAACSKAHRGRPTARATPSREPPNARHPPRFPAR